MRLTTSIFVFFSLLLAPPAFAQNGGLGDIFEDIFGGQTQIPSPRFPQAQIDNIPVAVFNDDGRDLTGHILIVTAYAVPPANVRLAKPQFLGETRLLLTSLGDPLEVVVAAPARVTQDIDAARLAARVVDENGTLILKSRDDTYYRGREAGELRLISASGAPASPVPISSSAKETLLGTAVLNRNAAPLPRGGTLHVTLTETAPPNRIVAESEINIDQKSAPFSYSLQHPDISAQPTGKYIVSASIKDWAGRLTHKSKIPMQYSGPKTNYLLELQETSELAGSPLAPTVPAATAGAVTGQAIFDAYKGLPAGSKMNVIIKNAQTPDRIIASQIIELDGLSGPVNFDIPVPQNSQRPPLIEIRITDTKNTTLFAGPLTEASSGFVIVRLRTDPRY